MDIIKLELGYLNIISNIIEEIKEFDNNMLYNWIFNSTEPLTDDIIKSLKEYLINENEFELLIKIEKILDNDKSII
jgi:alpha-amylase/alpha-mannosidase (GH57 family)